MALGEHCCKAQKATINQKPAAGMPQTTLGDDLIETVPASSTDCPSFPNALFSPFSSPGDINLPRIDFYCKPQKCHLRGKFRVLKNERISVGDVKSKADII